MIETDNAKKIQEIINGSNEHLTAEEIFLEFKRQGQKISLATVYNNLNTLYEQGLIQKVSIAGYPDRYDKTVRHDHLVCKECGRLSDVILEDLTERLKKQIDVEIITYDLKICYICSECKKISAQSQSRQ